MYKTFAFIGCLFCTGAIAQTTPPAPYGPVPTADQLAWQRNEMNAFIHFTVNTFTDREWGLGSEPETVFNPTALDAGQWAKVLKEAGFKEIILTAKHHDGFCLWPSAYTEHSVKNSPFKGDVVKAVSDACRKNGLKFGVYLSPWDRNNAQYGRPAYITYYRHQLTELLSNYGPISELWLDGANGGEGYYGGANERRTIDRRVYYDWPTTIKMVRSLQPHISIFSDGGPDIRWVGDEEGYAGETNWCTVTRDTLYPGKSDIDDLLIHGSATGADWVPAETDVSIRPGWFYHASEDTLVKTPEALFEIYLKSVGRGATLLLNVPPDRRGRFTDNDVKALRGFRKILDQAFAHDLAAHATVTADNVRGNAGEYSAMHLTDGNPDTYWATDDGKTSGSFDIGLKEPQVIKYIVLQEYIPLGQRVKSFNVEVWNDGAWKKVADGTTIGYKRILKVDPVMASKVRVNITDAKACLVLSNAALY
ncbi:MAG TPA: alpha-L-fucosidase [Dinghuibacter sp.]|uniref:alpha-L-fucosidase n=1 Tax=Dinghuibacter sp. TaxID=2024697 RepID=UPI002BC51BC7|nr:alpha-L-fucosidase [Dinghuibacter sp.]HTJ14313.1 alpha-L-fucosidase [Dinghuibacter sp.]